MKTVCITPVCTLLFCQSYMQIYNHLHPYGYQIDTCQCYGNLLCILGISYFHFESNEMATVSEVTVLVESNHLDIR